MPFQIPKKTHPWRQYKDRVVKTEEVDVKDVKPVKTFLTEILEDWESVSVSTFAWGRSGDYKLTELPQRRIASWLANFLKRNYA